MGVHHRDFDASDIVSGIFFVTSSLGGMWLSRHLPFGNMSDLGPGFSPRVLSCALLMLGSILIWRGSVWEGHPIEPWTWRPIFLIPGAVILFGLLVDHAGVFLASFASVLLGSASSSDVNFKHAILMGLGLATFTVIVFVVLLSIPMPVWPRW